MKPGNKKTWFGAAAIFAVAAVLVLGIVYIAQSGLNSQPEPPKGSIYYKGRMQADIESEARDPRKKHNGTASAPATR